MPDDLEKGLLAAWAGARRLSNSTATHDETSAKSELEAGSSDDFETAEEDEDEDEVQLDSEPEFGLGHEPALERLLAGDVVLGALFVLVAVSLLSASIVPGASVLYKGGCGINGTV